MTEETQRIIRGRDHILTMRLAKQPTADVASDSSFDGPGKAKEGSKIENGLAVQLGFLRLKALRNILNILLLLSIVMLFLYYELDFRSNPHAQQLLAMAYLVHLAVCAMLFLQEWEDWTKLNHNEKQYYNKIQPLLRLGLALSVYPFPGLSEWTVEMEYQDGDYANLSFPLKVNYLLLLAGMMKHLLLLVPNLLVNSYYYQPRSRRIIEMYSLSVPHYLYAFKCLFKDIPIKLFVSLFIVVLLYFSFAIRVVERGIPIPQNPFEFYENCVWFIAITVTTVGFGDFIVRSSAGYAILVFCVLWGTMNISSMVVILVNTLTLNSKETEALQILGRIELTCRHKQVCGEYIRESLWRVWLNYKNGVRLRESRREKRLKAELASIKQRGISELNSGNFQEQLRYHFDNALINTDYLRQNNNHLLSFISNNMFMDSSTGTQILITDRDDPSPSPDSPLTTARKRSVAAKKRVSRPKFNRDNIQVGEIEEIDMSDLRRHRS